MNITKQVLKIIKGAFVEGIQRAKIQGFNGAKFSINYSPRFNLTSDERYHLQFMPIIINGKELDSMIEIWDQRVNNGKNYTINHSFNKSEITKDTILNIISEAMETHKKDGTASY